MPTYEYSCTKCGHQFECVQSMSAPALETCPKDVCPKKTWGKGKVKRTIGAGAGLIFKGSGFYITDYRSEGYKAAAKKDGSSSSDSKPSTPTASSSTSTPAKSSPAPSPAPSNKSSKKPKSGA